jgi:hypothetical protein
MEPSMAPTPAPGQISCDVCDQPVPAGRLRDDRCVEAARQAIREAYGQPVRASDIIAVRRRMG